MVGSGDANIQFDWLTPRKELKIVSSLTPPKRVDGKRFDVEVLCCRANAFKSQHR